MLRYIIPKPEIGGYGNRAQGSIAKVVRPLTLSPLPEGAGRGMYFTLTLA